MTEGEQYSVKDRERICSTAYQFPSPSRMQPDDQQAVLSHDKSDSLRVSRAMLHITG